MRTNYLTRLVYGAYFVFAALLVLYSFLSPKMSHYADVLCGFVFLSPVGYMVLRKGAGLLTRANGKRCFFVLLGACFCIKLIWVLRYKIMPEADYKTFFDTAALLSRNFVIHDNYAALFPHIMGYSLFLSVFFKVLGAHYIIAPVLNVCLSALSMALIYYICAEVGGRGMAVTASLLWIISPSQTIYNMLTLSEPLYCTILLMCWAVILFIYKRFSEVNTKIIILASILLAFLFTIFNMTRPIAPVAMIAFTLWLIFVDKTKGAVKKAVLILTVFVCYAGFSVLGTQYINLRLGEQAAAVPGYSVYVGLNGASEGTWNAQDSALLDHYSALYGGSAVKAQRQMLSDAVTKIKNGTVDIPRLLYNKYLIFMGDDSAAAYYARASLPHWDLLSTACNIFYFFLIAVSVIGVLRAIEHRNRTPLVMICLYAPGLILAQMLVEVAIRYHYSIIPPILILASYGITGKKQHAHSPAENPLM
jgi:hypothetical protein